MDLKPRFSRDGEIINTELGWQLKIPDGSSRSYRLAQLDDQQGIPRSAYPWHPPLTMHLSARLSSTRSPGTWGFGFWNDPFGFSFGPGDTFLRLPALPRSIWFFNASPKNHLSFRDDRPGQGFLAQVFQSPRFDPALLTAGLLLPFSRRAVRRLLSKVITEDSININIDQTKWHSYRIEWRSTQSKFWVDEKLMFDSPVSPTAPLGLVIWIDNQYAAFTPNGKLRWGLEVNPQSEWLEIEGVEIKSLGIND